MKPDNFTPTLRPIIRIGALWAPIVEALEGHFDLLVVVGIHDLGGAMRAGDGGQVPADGGGFLTALAAGLDEGGNGRGRRRQGEQPSMPAERDKCPQSKRQARRVASGYTRRAFFHQARTFSAGGGAFWGVSTAAAAATDSGVWLVNSILRILS